MDLKIKEKIKELRELVLYHNHKYFVLDMPEIDDYEYDKIFRELKQLEEQYLEEASEGINQSPTQNVGSDLREENIKQVKYEVPMLSLEKSMNVSELLDFILKLKQNGVTEVIAQKKMDGLSGDVLYAKGVFSRGSTRGDGRLGEDVTLAMYEIKDLPKEISESDLNVRGEVYLKVSEFNKLNEERKKLIDLGDTRIKLLANPRNTASGSLKQKDPIEVRKRNLSFKVFSMVNAHTKFETEEQSLNHLKNLGFDVVDSKVFKVTDIEGIKKYLEECEKERLELDYEIDGLVWKCNYFKDQQRLGLGTNAPKWATAYKFTPLREMTKLLSVVWDVGAKSSLTPSAKITPTKIGGVVVSSITLHNTEEIKRLDLMINDYIYIERRGDVIPKVVGVAKEKRDGTQIEIEIPNVCPICNKELDKTGTIIKCINLDCQAKTFFAIEIWVKALEIENIGPSLINKLLELSLVKDAADLYNLKEEQLYDIERMGKKSAKKVIENINKSKEESLEKIILGLGILNVGSQTAEDLAKKFISLEKLMNVKYLDLLEINNIGETTATNITDYFKIEKNKILVEKILALGLGKYKEKEKSSNKFEGKTFCFTGTLSKPRDEFEKIVKNNGGEIKGLNKKLHYLVVGENAGSKLEKAKELQTVTILNEDQFLRML